MGGSTPVAPGRIFISYRRQETAYPAAWLYERVAAHFGREQVFKDVDSIVLGDDFAEVIANAVGSCDVLLALIGDRWLTITNEDGRRRLDDPDDFVRLEIETALERKIRVIPVLFEGARLPRAGELPASLAKLVRRQALELSPSRFDADIVKLLRVLDATLAEEQARREAAKAAREAEEQARREAEARAAREAEARAAREAEEQAGREDEERKLSAVEEMADYLRSGDPPAVASAEGALRRLAGDADQLVAQAAASILATWQAEAKAQQEAEASRDKAGREREEREPSNLVVSPTDIDFGLLRRYEQGGPRIIRLSSLPSDQIVRFSSDDRRIKLQRRDTEILVRIDTSVATGKLDGRVTIETEDDRATARIRATIDSATSDSPSILVSDGASISSPPEPAVESQVWRMVRPSPSPPARIGLSPSTKWIAAGIVAVLVAVIGLQIRGGGASSGASRSGGGSVALPTSPPTTIGKGGVLFSDDFSTQSSWVEDDRGTSERRYLNGAYQIVAKKVNVFAPAAPEANETRGLDRVRIDVDVRKRSGSSDSDYGVTCFYTGLDDGYRFYVGEGDDDYRIDIVKDGKATQPGLGFTTAPRKGALNHIRATCAADSSGSRVTLVLDVNGKRVGKVTDNDPLALDTNMSVGLFVRGGSKPPVDVRFDNFTVREV